MPWPLKKPFEKVFHGKKPNDDTQSTRTTTPSPQQSIPPKSNRPANLAPGIDQHASLTSPTPAIEENDHLDPLAEIWTTAYDAIAIDKKHSELFGAYNAVLSSRLTPTSDNDKTTDARKRMGLAVEEGLRRTERTAGIMDKAHEGMRVVSSVKTLIGRVVKRSPEAAAAWVGVCLLIEVSIISLSKKSMV